MSGYEIRETRHFQRMYKKLVKRDRLLAKKIEDVVVGLSENPFQERLRTHRANTKLFGRRWSSRVSGDLRIVWDFVEGKTVILAITLGGHGGGRAVYK